MTKTTSSVQQLKAQPIRKEAIEPRAKMTPLSRMLSRGGIVYVPIRHYLRRLQVLYKARNFRGHANLLYPGLAYVLGATEEQLANSFVTILGESKLGEHLEGLESLFLSSLHGLQTAGKWQLSEIGIGAWARYHRKDAKRPLIFVDRQTKQLKYIYASAVPEVLTALTPALLTNTTVGKILKNQERAIEAFPGGYINKAEQVDAADCKDKVIAWNGVATTLFSAAAVGAQSLIKDKDTASAVLQWSAIGIGAGSALGTLVGIYGCNAYDNAQSEQESAENVKKIADAVSAGMAQAKADQDEALAEKLVRDAAGGLTGPSLPGDYGVPDTNGAVNDWATNPNSATLPPTAVASSDNTNRDNTNTDHNNTDNNNTDNNNTDNTITIDNSETVAFGMPNPDDAGESHAWPPQLHWPYPPEDMPNPDDSGPGGPTLLPNGAVFVPLRLLTVGARIAAVAVFGITTSREGSAISSVQISTTTAMQSAATR